MDDKDVMEACVPKIRSISQEPSAARGVGIEANCGAWRRVGGLQVIRFLGFPYGGSRRTSMYLVLVGEASICTNLKGGGGTNCLGCDMRQWQDSNYEPWELCDVVGFRFEDKQRHCGFVLCMYESSLLCRDVCLMSRTKFGFDTMLNLLVTRCVIPCCIC